MPKQSSSISRYGLRFDSAISELDIEKYCYKTGRTVEQGGLGLAGHFRNIVNLVWGSHNKRKHFVWHPWAEQMNEEVHFMELLSDGSYRQRRYLGVSGCGSSGKSDFFSVYPLVNWLCDPVNTLCLCTSTNLKESRLRIWGAIKDYFEAMPEAIRPGRLVDSQGMLVSENDKGEKLSDRSGIVLIAGEKKREREAIGKLIGMKNKRVIFVADELPELSEALAEAAYSNLSLNPFFQMIGIGNFKSRYDSFGQFVQPKAGWDSITIDSDEWETERGLCIRFDGLKSPNVTAGRNIWPIYGMKHLAAHRKDLGEHTASFYRMCRSFEAEMGLDDCIYSEIDFTAGKAYEKVVWLNKPVRVSFMDPSFTNGGDRCVQFFGSFGTSKDGVRTVSFDSYKLLREDIRKKEPRDYQIARQYRDNCVAEGVLPKHAGLDATAAGAVLWSIISEEWSPEVLKVDFSGAPSEMAVAVNSAKTGKQSYDRKVSELWYIGKDFLKYGQLRGITPEVAREMKARKYETVKGTDGLKIRVETKCDMKQRLLFSPDLADAAFGLLYLCRQRLGAVPGGSGLGAAGFQDRFKQTAQKQNEVYRDLYAEEMEIAA